MDHARDSKRLRSTDRCGDNDVALPCFSFPPRSLRPPPFRPCPTCRRPRTARAPRRSGPAATARAASRSRAPPASARSSPTARRSGRGTPRTAPSRKGTAPARPEPDRQVADPTKAATDALAALQPTSTVTVDGTAEVAGRPAYELVLTPKPTERTLLREVRIAVDAQERMPLRLTVFAQGSTDARAAGRVHRAHLRPAGPGAVHVHPAAGRDGEGRPEPRRAAASATSRRSSATAGTRRARRAGARRTTRTGAKSLAGARHARQRLVGQRTADHHRGRRPRSSPTTGGSRWAPFPSRCCPRHCRGDLPVDRGCRPRRGRCARSGVCARCSARRSRSTGSTSTCRPASVLGHARAERLGQDHADPDAARPDPPDRGHRRAARATRIPERGPRCRTSARWSRARGSTRSCPAGRTCCGSRPPSRCSPRATIPAAVDAALDRVGPRRRRRPPLPRLLARHEAAARAGRRRCCVPRRLVVLDEPTNGLDPAGTRDVRRIIAELHADGATVIVSSHLLAEVEATCTHVAVLQAGSLVAVGRAAPRCCGRARAGSWSPRRTSTWRCARCARPARRPTAATRRARGRRRRAGRPRRRSSRCWCAAGVAVHEARRSRAKLEELFARLTEEP